MRLSVNMPILDNNEIQGSRTRTYLTYIDQAVQRGLALVVPENTQPVVIDIPGHFLEKAVNNTAHLTLAEVIAALCQAGRLNRQIPSPAEPAKTASGFLPDRNDIYPKSAHF